MDTSCKNRLQEYCQQKKYSLPSYRIKKQFGPDHALKFQAEVEVNGQWYVGHDYCASKKEADQSAADNAWHTLVARKSYAHVSTLKVHLSCSKMKRKTTEHLPDECAGIEHFLANMTRMFGGQIGKIWTPNIHGMYKTEITGSYRYCENIQKHHKKNPIYFLVNPVKKTFHQKCYHRKCLGFRSSRKSIIDIQKKNNILRKCRKHDF